MKLIWKYIFKKALLDLKILKWFRDNDPVFMAKLWRRLIYV